MEGFALAFIFPDGVWSGRVRKAGGNGPCPAPVGRVAFATLFTFAFYL